MKSESLSMSTGENIVQIKMLEHHNDLIESNAELDILLNFEHNCIDLPYF